MAQLWQCGAREHRDYILCWPCRQTGSGVTLSPDCCLVWNQNDGGRLGSLIQLDVEQVGEDCI